MNYNVKWDVIGFLFVTAGTILSFIGCNSEEMKLHHIDYSIREMSTELHYYKDTNTHLCFAAMNLSMQSATMTNVPCTPEVEKMAHGFISDSK